MCSRCNERMGCDCIRATRIMEGERPALCSRNLGFLGNHSNLSAVDTARETSLPTLVYKRRKFQDNPTYAVLPNVAKNTPTFEGRVYRRKSQYKPTSTIFPYVPAKNTSAYEGRVYRRRFQRNRTPTIFPHVSAKNTPTCKVHVYRRRKHYNPAIVFPTGVLENEPPNAGFSGAHASSLRSENRYFPMEKQEEHEALHIIEGVRSSMSIEICSDEPVLTHSGAIECLAEHHVSDAKGEKNLELHSVDDSCSSSMINLDMHSASLKGEVAENGECSSSGAFVVELMGEDISGKDLCISILKSHGLLSCFMPKNYDTSVENTASSSGVRNSCQCNVCGLLGTTENMLICDHCEEAFHFSCCNPTMRKTCIDEWFCQCCLKKKHKIMQAAAGSRSTIIRSNSSFRPATSKAKISPIALMLKDSEPYTTGVRIGKDFQAIVPCWSGCITEGIDAVEEPVDLDPSHICSFHELSSEQFCKPKPISNWLQCGDIIDGPGESEGTICGKWRRAPLFEVQNDKWDCFSSVLWDPTRADCAVPQELGTEEILKQLKYIEMLRPRLVAKKHRLDAAETNDSEKPDDG